MKLQNSLQNLEQSFPKHQKPLSIVAKLLYSSQSLNSPFNNKPVPPQATAFHTATRYNTLQHTATHCNTLQHTVILCNTLQHTSSPTAFHTWLCHNILETLHAVMRSSGNSGTLAHLYAGLFWRLGYTVIPGHRNRQIETAAWNLDVRLDK